MTGLKRGVSVSHFLENGNALSPTMTNYPPSDDLDLNFDADLSKFTNLEWSEFDLHGAGPFDADEGAATDAAHKRLKTDTNSREEEGAEGTATTASGGGETDWTTAAQYDPFEMATAAGAGDGGAPSMPGYDATLQHQTGATNTTPTDYTSAYPSTAGSLAHHAFSSHHQPPQTYPSTASADSPAQSLEDNPAARAAAEEDKRRRNTAASARFRVKKKQREQALEKTADELKTRAAELEQQVGQLQRENEWLRGLVVLKSGESVKEDGGEKEEDLVKAKGEPMESKAGKLKKGYGTES